MKDSNFFVFFSFAGNFLYVIGGHDAERNQATKIVERIDVKNNGENISIEELFEVEKDFSSVDCCVVRTNRFNQHLLPLASFLDHWIVW